MSEGRYGLSIPVGDHRALRCHVAGAAVAAHHDPRAHPSGSVLTRDLSILVRHLELWGLWSRQNRGVDGYPVPMGSKFNPRVKRDRDPGWGDDEIPPDPPAIILSALQEDAAYAMDEFLIRCGGRDFRSVNLVWLAFYKEGHVEPLERDSALRAIADHYFNDPLVYQPFRKVA